MHINVRLVPGTHFLSFQAYNLQGLELVHLTFLLPTVQMCVYQCICMYVCMNVYMYACMICMYMNECMYIYMYICIIVDCMYVYNIYVLCMYKYVYVYVYTCLCMCTWVVCICMYYLYDDVDENILKNYFEKLFWKYYFYLVFSK